MMKSIPRKKLSIIFLFVISSVALIPAEVPRIGIWSRASAELPAADDSLVSLPLFSVARVLPRAFDRTETFSAHLSGLVSGAAYIVALPYASRFALSDNAGSEYGPAGGTSLAVSASGSELELTATVSPGFGKSELYLRGARVRSVSSTASALAVPWFALFLLAFFLVIRIFLGIRSSIRDKARVDEAFFALSSLAGLLLAAAMFRYISILAFSSFTAEFEGRVRSIGGILFPLAALGGVLATKPFRGGSYWFFGAAVLGGAACVASVLPIVPAPLPLAVFSALMALGFIALAAVCFTLRRHFDALLAAFALFGAAALCVSAFAVDPLLESILSCAAPIPFIAASLRVRIPTVRAEAIDPVLSDYVDQVSIALTRFVPKEFLAILDKANASELKLGDHIKKDMTIFFSDIRSFTALSEGLTPEENFRFINSYLARVVPVVTENGGFVDKYIGDAIMALFPSEGGADAAVRAAIEMQKRIVEYNGHRANCGYRPLAMGIGLHTGTLMLGVVGVEDRMQSTVISDAVNLASRLESITKVFNVSLAISEETFKSLADPGAYMYRFIGKVRVKGKNEPVSVFEIFDGVDESMFERKMKANRFFEQGMLAYYQKDFPGAMFYFRKVVEVLPEDGASAFYLDNCLAKARV